VEAPHLSNAHQGSYVGHCGCSSTADAGEEGRHSSRTTPVKPVPVGYQATRPLTSRPMTFPTLQVSGYINL